ncbi:glycosyltransferase involved in cell wall biosynthesis [Promicromonospora iranensis]|uniref:Glycosyltransferase involved in cell wall biosynthesis n=1 Tax=Promicromonospora iranensis TaxID=1105144 RepID=A0ABU2CL41_9MICO|nr:glycosyltransferase involved in cell wall biosynthesis [Promicromonospora iranensis]
MNFREHSHGLGSRAADQLVAAISSVLRGVRPSAGRPAVVIATVPGIPSVIAGWALARWHRARFVVEMRDAWPDLIEPSGILLRRSRTGGLRRRLRDLAARAVHRTVTRIQTRADLVVTTTAAFAEVLRARGVRDVAVVRNGTAFAPVRGNAPVVLTGRPLRVVYAGTVGRSQGLDVAVRAAALVKERGYALDVRIVGHGNELAPLRQLAAELDAPVRVEPSVPSTEVRELYAWADTVVVSLRDWEPFEWTVPSKLYEVMASGVVASACLAGEAASLVSANGAGAVVRPGDVEGLADLWCGWLSDGVVPAASSDAAAWVAEHASDEVLGHRYTELLDTLLPSPLPDAPLDRRVRF